MKIYTGVGSRDTPREIADLMEQVGFKLAQMGWVLRSGAAGGADSAFERGCDDAGGVKEIYIPWCGFNGRANDEDGVYTLMDGDEARARLMVRAIHPAPDNLSRGAMALHARNCYQVAGLQMDTPAHRLICWAKVDKAGDPVGGTRTAWMYAKKLGIRCINLYNEDHLNKIKEWINA